MFGINKDIQEEVCGEGVTRKILTYDADLMLVEVKFEKNAIGALHAHKHQQISYVAKGSFEFTLGEVCKIVKQGDSIYIPSDVVHGVRALEEAIIVDVFTPMREDFIK